ncbi:hypothetical protein J6590_103704 [Homalodisca vitripennis]|nr:hypothetical protein J6590_103704 [Homalodisca vitripennis]
MRKGFMMIDIHKTGSIETSKIAEALNKMGLEMFDEEKLEELIDEVDVDETGKVDFDQFCQIVGTFLEEEDAEAMQAELKEAFRLYDKEERHITNRKCRDSGAQEQFDRSSLLREMTVGVEVLAILNKGVPPPAYFDWRGWFRAGLPFIRGDMTLRFNPLFTVNNSQSLLVDSGIISRIISEVAGNGYVGEGVFKDHLFRASSV